MERPRRTNKSRDVFVNVMKAMGLQNKNLSPISPPEAVTHAIFPGDNRKVLGIKQS